MADRLTRRERAAMQLALEILSRPPPSRGRRALWAGAAVCEAECAMMLGGRALGQLTLDARVAMVVAKDPRPVRARLALYLRARLRADAGWDERAPWWWCSGGRRTPGRWECEGAGEHSRITPLWERAPAHEEDR